MSHGEKQTDTKRQAEDQRIAKEFMPYLLYAAIPVLIIVFMALKWGPSY